MTFRSAPENSIITRAEYRFLDAAEHSFESEWFNLQFGNDLYPGVNGDGAQNLYDAFCAWKNEGGKFTITGLSTKFDPEKVTRFSKVVERWRREFED